VVTRVESEDLPNDRGLCLIDHQLRTDHLGIAVSIEARAVLELHKSIAVGFPARPIFLERLPGQAAVRLVAKVIDVHFVIDGEKPACSQLPPMPGDDRLPPT
jgi:hypothetical protein